LFSPTGIPVHSNFTGWSFREGKCVGPENDIHWLTHSREINSEGLTEKIGWIAVTLSVFAVALVGTAGGDALAGNACWKDSLNGPL
jgi:hypothetical protein